MWRKITKNKGIHPPNNTAVNNSIINTAKNVVQPKLAPMSVLLSFNLRLLPLVGAVFRMRMGQDGMLAKMW